MSACTSLSTKCLIGKSGGTTDTDHNNSCAANHHPYPNLPVLLILVLCCRVSGLDDEAFGALHNTIRRGDLVGVKGLPGKSKRGELSVFPQSFIVLAPCLHMLPKYKLENQV